MTQPNATSIEHTGQIVGEAARLDEQEQERFEAHVAEHFYGGLAREARLEALLLEARDAITIRGPSDLDLIRRIGRFVGAAVEKPVQSEGRDLVWERLPSCEFAWLKPALTVKP